jgi:hypothetical protein
MLHGTACSLNLNPSFPKPRRQEPLLVLLVLLV